jgi:hypothetical protein
MPVVIRKQAQAQAQAQAQSQAQAQKKNVQAQVIKEQVGICSETELYNNVKALITEKTLLTEKTQRLLDTSSGLIKLASTTNTVTEEMTIRQRKHRFSHLEALSDLMYVVQVELPKLHMTNYERFMFKIGKEILKSIKRLYKHIRQDWDESFSPQSSYESSIIQMCLEGFRDTEQTLLQFFPDEKKSMRNIERWIFLP